jgi:hypothetical protein
MILALPRMFNPFAALPHPSLTASMGSRRAAAASRGDEGPVFNHAGFATLAPDLTGELRQALGDQAARDAGDVP